MTGDGVNEMFSDVKKRDLNGKTKDPAENKCIM
jgi:hypothetical protein